MDTEELLLLGGAALLGIFVLPKFFAAGESGPLTSGFGYAPGSLGAPVPATGQPPTSAIRGLDGTQKTASLAEHFVGVAAGGPVGIGGELLNQVGKALGGGNATVGSKIGDYNTVSNGTVKIILGKGDSGYHHIQTGQLASGFVETDASGRKGVVQGFGDAKTGKGVVARDHRASSVANFSGVSKQSDTAAQKGPFSTR